MLFKMLGHFGSNFVPPIFRIAFRFSSVNRDLYFDFT